MSKEIYLSVIPANFHTGDFAEDVLHDIVLALRSSRFNTLEALKEDIAKSPHDPEWENAVFIRLTAEVVE